MNVRPGAVLVGSTLLALVVAGSCSARGLRPDPVPSSTVEEARSAVEAKRALLVCAYSDTRCADGTA